MNKKTKLLSVLFLYVTFSNCTNSFCQFKSDSSYNNNSSSLLYTYGGEINLILTTHRTFSLPTSIINSSFYENYFKGKGDPDRSFSYKKGGFQIGGNISLRLPELLPKFNHEWIFSVGYQSTGRQLDSLYRITTNVDTSYTSYKLNMEHKINELYLGSAFIFKTNHHRFNLFGGLGFNVNLSIYKIAVEEFHLGNSLNSYTVRDDFKTYGNIYIPLGFEINTHNSNSKSGFLFKFHTSVRGEIRKENNNDLYNSYIRWFGSVGLSVQYKF